MTGCLHDAWRAPICKPDGLLAGVHITPGSWQAEVPIGRSRGARIRRCPRNLAVNPVAVLLTALLLLGCLLLGPGPVWAADQQVARDVLVNQDYQTSLPAARRPGDKSGTPATGQNAPSTQPSTPPDSAAGSAGLPPADSSGAKGASATTIALLKLVPTAILAVLVLLLLYFGLRAFQRRRRATAPREEQTSLPAETAVAVATAPASATLPEWQLLADQGRFNDAIHLLLLQALGQLRHNHLLVPAISQTGREILRMKNLPETHRPGLSTIIGAVEFCHFGGRPAGPQLYQHCVDAYQQITTASVAR